MISDWSGSALDYAFGLNKPVLFMDVPRKVNNPNYEKIPLTPIEVSIREKIGDIAQPGADNIVAKVKECYNKTMPPDLLTNIYNIGKSGEVGAAYIIELAQTLYKKDGVGTEDCGFLC
jgi:YidC/Oxa1 family membrane protein insertase